MNLCPNCAAEAIPGAKFCHRCGEPMREKTKPCPACQEQSPLASVFCHHCGFHFEGKRNRPQSYQPRFPLDYHVSDLTEQVKALFFKSLRTRIESEHDISAYPDYVERFYQSRFREIYGIRSQQIARAVHLHWERFGESGLPEIDQKIDQDFEGLLDFFVIQYCPDLNGVILPAAILKYEHAKPETTNLGQMVFDFLDLEHEEEPFYTQFYKMPSVLLANACKYFLSADRREKVLFIADLSLKSTCKEGFAMTDRAIYWRAPFDKARCVPYELIRDLRKEKDWITINGHFFTSNPGLNLKLYKLLKKLKQRKWAIAAAQS
ncbi:MAG: zinc ribbon domain-containing protein [Bacteroidetes bacterium]|nr:zinc ribbon domain-containing protein [Bacteroidota bacterium]